MPKDADAVVLSIEGREVRVTHPNKLYFSKEVRITKLDLVRYYLSVAPGALHGIRDRPLVLKRFVEGAEGDAFYQKRAPAKRPEWLRTVSLSFPSGRMADEIVVDDAAGLAWIINLGCIELHPHSLRSSDLDHPDELRIDLDPVPGVPWSDVRLVALEVQHFLDECGLRGWPKTSGSRGLHITRVAPSRARSAAKRQAAKRTKMPLIAIANSPSREQALAGLERWKNKYPAAAKLLATDDVLVDSMRGRSSTWTRIRVNLRHVPESLRPPQETPDPDDDPTREWWRRRRHSDE